jgi:DNA recombination protein RmuC
MSTVPLLVQWVLAFGVGGFLGWLMGRLTGHRAVIPPDSRLENELRLQLQQRETELQSVREQASRNASALSAAEANRAAMEKMLVESREFHATQMAAAKEAQEKALADLRQTFQALSAEALRQNGPQFLQLANETFAKFQENAKGDLAQREQAIKTLVEPLKVQLENYQRRLQQSENTQSTALGEVKKQLEGLALNSQSLSSETLQLRRVLSSNQARGRWGEETLRRVVEAAGMSPHCDFVEQAILDDKKPDMIVRLPGDRIIIIDAKVPDLDFLQALDSADTLRRAEALGLHADKLKGTIRDLARKNYPGQYGNALDYVVLFLPAESLFSAALEADRELLVWAAQQQILLATPTSLIALLRVVSVSWKQHDQTENAREIAETAQELYTRVIRFFEHFEKIRAGLERATSSFNEAIGSYDRMVRPSGERLQKLGAGNAVKELPQIELLNNALRLPPSGPS